MGDDILATMLTSVSFVGTNAGTSLDSSAEFESKRSQEHDDVCQRYTF